MSDSEGADVRRAIDGPDLDHDALIAKATRWNREDRSRASSAAGTRQDIGTFIEDTGINSKALSWCRTILKAADKGDGQAKAMDIIRSLETALPMIKAHVSGQSTPDMFADGETVNDAPEQTTDDFGAWDEDGKVVSFS